MNRLLGDIRYSLRLMLKSPAFTSVAVLSLALGIGANTTIFTIINAVFFRPLPVEDINRVVQVGTSDKNNPLTGFAVGPVSFRNFEDFRAQNDVFTELSAMTFANLTLSGNQREPVQVPGFLVSANYFAVLGTHPKHGRTFYPDEDKHPGSDLLAILSHSLWAREFGADPSLVGKQITLNSRSFTVIGIMPPGFKGTFALGNPDMIWVPISLHQELLPPTLASSFLNRRALFNFVYGRLKPGVETRQAETALVTIAARLEKEYPQANKDRSAKLMGLREASLGFNPQGARLVGMLLMSVVGLVLLIACGNLANLLLARGSIREKEMGIRASLGAGRGLLMRQLITESVVLSLAGGLMGLLMAYWGRDLLWSFRPPFLDADAVDLSLDGNVLLFTVAVSLLTGLLFGLMPAIRTSDPNLNTALKASGRQGTGGVGGNRLRASLIVAEVALSVMVLVGAGLFVRSMQNAQQIDLGFEHEKLFVIRMDLASRGYDQARGQQFIEDVISNAASVAGVEAAAVGSRGPLSGGFSQSVFPEGTSQSAGDKGILVMTNRITPDYFDTLRIPLLSGRLFTEFDRENTRRVSVINEAMAEKFWPGIDPVGKRFAFFGEEGQLREVIGLVRNSVVGQIGEDPQPQVYLPIRQDYASPVTLHVRTAGDPSVVLGTARAKVQVLDKNLALTGVNSIQGIIDQGLWAPRLGAGLLSLFGLLALALAAVGIYGVLAYNVNQRTQEIGIRMAMGAKPGDVFRMIIGRGSVLGLIGVVIGLISSFAVTRVFGSLLYGISPTDWVTFLGIPVILVIVVVLACYLPARRATKVDPITALRYE